jgi:hypothetical protein
MTAQAGRQFEAYQSDLPTPDVKGEETSEKDICIILQLGYVVACLSPFTFILTTPWLRCQYQDATISSE